SSTMKSTGLLSDASGVVYKTGTLATNQGGTVVQLDTRTASYDPVAKDVSLGGTGEAAAIVIYGNGLAGDKNENHGVVVGANYDDGGKYLLASRNLMDLKIDSDGNAGDPFINIAAEVSGLDINIGKI